MARRGRRGRKQPKDMVTLGQAHIRDDTLTRLKQVEEENRFMDEVLDQGSIFGSDKTQRKKLEKAPTAKTSKVGSNLLGEMMGGVMRGAITKAQAAKKQSRKAAKAKRRGKASKGGVNYGKLSNQYKK